MVTYPAMVTARTGLPIMGMIPSINDEFRGKIKTKSIDLSELQTTGSTIKGIVEMEMEIISAPLPDMLRFFSTAAEQYRFVRSNIQASLKNQLADTRSIAVMIASAVRGEGRTTTIFNIALSFCQKGMKVVIVDAELRKPRIHELLGLPLERGLSSYLWDTSVAVEELVIKSPVPNLHVITAGPIPPYPSELIGSQRMDSLISSLKEKYDIVIFDSSPLLPFVDAQELARKVDASIIIAQYRRLSLLKPLSLDKLVEAVNTLRNTGTALLGIVINNVPIRDYKRLRSWYKNI
jgi:capsular exopolysaccharide synthesis family protein